MRYWIVIWVLLSLGWLYGMSTFGSLFHLTIGVTAVIDITGMIYMTTALILGGWPKGGA